MKQRIKKTLARFGCELVHSATRDQTAVADLSPADHAIVARVAPFTHTRA